MSKAIAARMPGWWDDPKDVLAAAHEWVGEERTYALPGASVTERFHTLASQWKVESLNTSSVSDIIESPTYKAIIGMGSAVVPLIVDAFFVEPAHWHTALVALTHADPVPDDHAGDLEAMALDWMDWALQHGVFEI